MRRVRLPSMITDLITSAVLSFDGAVFDSLDRCPECDGEIRPHDMKEKRFATVLIDENPRRITVHVKRFRCLSCGALCYAKAPFYPGTRLGAPVVDLCVTLLRTHPYHFAARILREMDILVDRGTIRSYALRNFPAVPSVEMYGLEIPLSLLSISEHSFRREKADK